jgi:prepilin-type N-terminal cleavage/methylation domain-containing protein
MALLRRVLPKKGFTLIELLVVIAIIATLAALLTPVVSTALLRGRVTQVLNNGREMYRLLFSKQTENPLGLQTRGGSLTWPTTADSLGDSTEYFAQWVTNRSFSINYAFFAAPGIIPAQNENEFLDDKLRNAWCVTLDVTEDMFGSPVFFTQNIDLSGQTLSDFDNDAPMVETALPFGDKACVVVAYGGSAFSMDSDTAIATNFNPYGSANAVLYPKNGQY